VPAGHYSARRYVIEPDASSASYPLAAAAICSGSVFVPDLTDQALQGDATFADLLASMGCLVQRDALGTRVTGGGDLSGIDVDMADLSDLVPTVAVVAAFATTSTQITGVGFIRAKESDRLGDLAHELQRCGIDAQDLPDGLRINPSRPTPATLETHHDHRLAMAFAILGLRTAGVVINDPQVVTKSWPDFWTMLTSLTEPP
jgi:3-phosphoshikimate 1-carboxyvinyltransferase